MDSNFCSPVLVLQVKYKEGWEKTKGKGFEMKLDAISLLAAKASGELASNVGFLSLTQKCIGNGSNKMSVVLLKKIMTVNIVNITIL
jgi:hypothetical protein